MTPFQALEDKCTLQDFYCSIAHNRIKKKRPKHSFLGEQLNRSLYLYLGILNNY